jgi:hypothetical protein
MSALLTSPHLVNLFLWAEILSIPLLSFAGDQDTVLNLHRSAVFNLLYHILKTSSEMFC